MCVLDWSGISFLFLTSSPGLYLRRGPGTVYEVLQQATRQIWWEMCAKGRCGRSHSVSAFKANSACKHNTNAEHTLLTYMCNTNTAHIANIALTQSTHC